ncbi:MAG: malto-oligosyltrehalose trehalohydrolase [Pseudomonas sp.]|uniref:malto-oligosyltrehalose trehalohydrolase n=1 Tax=Pseudomonas sp. TaxID=306 RepID=UPI0033990508
MPAPQELHAGARLLRKDLTEFCLWAPNARQVEVEFKSGARHPMQAQADGWFSCQLPCGAATAYHYRIDQELRVPDPASRAQAGGLQGPSLVVDPTYAWRHSHWQGRPWTETVLYELHVGALGGFQGVQTHLQRLAELGITAIELMPINAFPGTRNWGYDGSLPFAPQSSYGTPEQLKALIDCAHGLGLQVFLDVVYNHFGPEGNYLGQYASGFFRQDQHTPWGQAIDFRRSQVRNFFIDNALMWLFEYRFDGLRLDAVHAISESYFLIELAAQVRARTEPGRHIHLVLENEHNAANLLSNGYTAQWNDDGHNVLHVLLTGEHHAYYQDFAQQPTEKLARCLAQGFIYQGQANRHGQARGEPSAHLPPSAFVLFLQNHDQIGNRALGERLIELCHPEALRAATALLLLSPMVPLLFMGEEWGCRQPFQFFTDFHDELAEAVSSGRRNEFADFPQFSDPASRDRIPDPNALDTFTHSVPRLEVGPDDEQRDWLAYYQTLLSLRHAELTARLPGTQALACKVLGEAAVRARWRLGDETLLTLWLNLADQALPVKPGRPLGRLLFESRAALAPQLAKGSLPARSALFYLEDPA